MAKLQRMNDGFRGSIAESGLSALSDFAVIVWPAKRS
jgi:hypothetical protein